MWDRGWVVLARFPRAWLVVVVVAMVGWLTPAAFAADSLYWADDGSGAIGVGNLDGTGMPTNLFSGESFPIGLAIDTAAGKIFWTEAGPNGVIRVANLNGTGMPANLFTGENAPGGLAIDPAAGKLYWADEGTGDIRVGNLDGTGTPTSLFGGEDHPTGVAIDPAAGKIYWTDVSSHAIRFANLDGSGTPQDLFTGESNPEFVAIDPGAGKIYWTDVSSGQIRVANLTGSGAPQDLFAGENVPRGVAIDAAAGKIYWADSNAIRVGNLNGSGMPANLFTGGSLASSPALLRVPVAAGAPTISGSSTAGSVLSCSHGLWASDLVGGFLYRAPETFAYKWRLNGADISGANSSSYTTSSPGFYTCQVTAANPAGAIAQTTAAHVVGAPVPTLTGLSVSPKTASVAGRLVAGHCVKPTIKNRTHKPCTRPIKLRIRYTLNGSATVTFTIKRLAPGRQVTGRCVKPTHKNSSHKRCTRLASARRIDKPGETGANSFTFSGRLVPGTYQLTATLPGGTRQRATFRFTS